MSTADEEGSGAGMTRDACADLEVSPGRRPPPAAEPTQGLGYDGDAGALGRAISHRVFSAGLDKDLWHLTLAVPGPAAGAVPDGLSGNEGFEPR